MKMAEDKGFMYVNGYDHPNIIAGAGTMGLEILEVECYDYLLIMFLQCAIVLSKPSIWLY
jgi:threonine dehydratase